MILFWWACAQAASPEDAVCLEDALFTMKSGVVAEASVADLSDPLNGRAIDPKLHGASALSVDADTVEWDLNAGTADFRGHVTAVRGGVTLRAEQLHVTLDESQNIKTAVATENVQIEAGDRTATCGQAELDIKSGRLHLSMNPKVVTSRGTFIGERLIIWIDDDKVQCEGECRVVLSEAE